MTDWWEVPYAGGGPAKPKGFPRPLYPPDAESGDSPDGPDIVAYKRTICRLGRWGEFDPNQWDNSYSNAFAHGKGPNVKDTGVEGFQRQMNISATGNLGEATFNALRYALVPPGRTNEGDQAMDGEAVRMINEAWDMFHAPPPDTDLASKLLDEMIRLIGKAEQPAGSNHVPGITDWYGMDRQPWCAMTCTRAGVNAGSIAFVRGSRWAYCPYIYRDARDGLHSLKLTTDPKPGDLVLFDWDWDTVHGNAVEGWDHVGMFEKWIQKGVTLQTIEGNIDSRCARHTRSVGAQALAYVRVRA